MIVGLGNPEPKYDDTRHNAGFWVLDALAEEWGLRFKQERGRARVAEHRFAGRPVVLAKPLTYMNRSGDAVRRLVDSYRTSPERLLVVYDDVDLRAGRLRLRRRGSAGTHNGMRSVIATLGTTEFPRLRVGVGPSRPGYNLVDFVLSPLGNSDIKQFRQSISQAAQAIRVWLDEGIAAAMNRFNRSD